MVDWTVDQKIRFATLFVTIIIMITGISVCFTKIIEVKKGLTIGDIERELKKANEEKNELKTMLDEKSNEIQKLESEKKIYRRGSNAFRGD